MVVIELENMNRLEQSKRLEFDTLYEAEQYIDWAENNGWSVTKVNII